MVNFKRIDPDTQGHPRVEFEATLTGISDTLLQNCNGTAFTVASISFINASGEERNATAFVYEKNLQKGSYKVGGKYTAVATIMTETNSVIITLAPFLRGERASIADFTRKVVEEQKKTANKLELPF